MLDFFSFFERKCLDLEMGFWAYNKVYLLWEKE